MKNLLQCLIVTSLFCFIINLSFAQTESFNLSFEEWTTLQNNKEMPLMWVSRDYEDVSHVYCQKETESYDGSFAFSLHNYHSQPGFCSSSYIDLGDYDSDDPENIGIDFYQRPTALTFYHKYFQSNPNSTFKGYLRLELKVWDDSLEYETIVGEASLGFEGNQNEFTFTEVPIVYSSTLTPERLYIRFGNPCLPSDSVSLAIDYVGFLGLQTTSIDEISTIETIRAIPNPVQHSFRLSKIDGPAVVELFNNVGQLVKVYTLNDATQNMNVVDLENGVYFYRLKNNTGAYSSGKIWILH